MLSGKVVLITGAAGGIGPSVARIVAAQGAYLALAGRREDEVCALAREIADARGFVADVTDEEQVGQLVPRVRETVGEIHGLVHLVGGYAGGQPLAQTETSTWERMLSLNLRSTFLMLRAVLPAMLERGEGNIVTVAARAAFEDGAGMAAYAVSKAAVVKLTQALAAEVRERGIQVNAVAPSIVDTPANRASMPRARHDRWVKPEEIARAVVFLLESEGVTGDVLKVYGRA